MNKLITFSAFALLLFGCAKETSLESQSGEGSVLFECATNVSVVTTTTKADDDAQTYELDGDLIPTSENFALHLTGEYEDYDTGLDMTYDKSFTSLDSYNDNVPLLAAGDYKAEITYGDMSIESSDNPCFYGELAFEIVARKYATATITASLSNSIITLETSEWFDKYYSQAQFTVTTSAGNEFSFNQSAEQQDMIFVASQSTLKLKGTAVNAQTGADVIFAETQIGVTTAQTLSTISINADLAGSATLSITFDQTLTEISLGDIELNPENNNDVEVEESETDQDDNSTENGSQNEN